MNNKTRKISMIALYSALAVVLGIIEEIIPIFKMPNGGNISLAIIPILICSFHLGWKSGTISGLLWWIIGFITGQDYYMVSLPQIIFDYIIPSVICGMASIVPNIKRLPNYYVGIIVTIIIRFLSFFISGVYFWMPEGEAAGSIAAIIYSFNYNIYYNLATMIVAVIVVPIILKKLKKAKIIK